jgi:lysozyme family protein
MRKNYHAIHEATLVYEGGYVNHPDDPGGATNFGVTQAVYDAYRKRTGWTPRPVREITSEEVSSIYRSQYWDRIMGDALPSGPDHAIYDFAVNSGVSRAIKFTQRIVGVKQDGAMGNVTLAAIKGYDPVALVQELCEARMSFLRRLKHWPTFRKGWTRRVMGNQPGAQDADIGVIDRATKLARGGNGITTPAPKSLPDGANAKADGTISTAAAASDVAKDWQGWAAAGLPSAAGIFAAVSEPPMAYFAGAALVLLAFAGMVLLLRRGSE